MPYYRITISFANGSGIKAIRYHNSWDIDFAYRYFQKKIEEHYSSFEVQQFEIVMVPKTSAEVKGFLSNRQGANRGGDRNVKF